MKPILLLTNGTRGDVQPLLALARGLQAAGYNLRAAAPPAFRDFVESHQLPFAPVEGNPSDLMTTLDGQSALTFDGNPVRSARATWKYVQRARPIYAQMLANAWDASRDASAIVIGLPTLWGVSIAEALGVPCIGAFPQPVQPTGDFPSLLIPSTFSLGRGYNRLSYFLAGLIVWLPWRGVINEWRTKTLRLKPFPLSGPSPRPFGHFDLRLHGFSEWVVPRPRDWDAKTVITGYWNLPLEEYTPKKELSDFLNAGEAPFYFGFGSPGLRAPDETVRIVLKAIELSHIRAVIAMPSGSSIQGDSAEVFFLRESVPHDWLFARMAGVIHHGGAGTTARRCEQASSLALPMAVDQFFWAKRIEELGAGPRGIPQFRLGVKNLVEKLEEMKEGKMKEAAQRLGQALRAEAGVTRAVEEIDKLLKR